MQIVLADQEGLDVERSEVSSIYKCEHFPARLIPRCCAGYAINVLACIIGMLQVSMICLMSWELSAATGDIISCMLVHHAMFENGECMAGLKSKHMNEVASI